MILILRSPSETYINKGEIKRTGFYVLKLPCPTHLSRL